MKNNKKEMNENNKKKKSFGKKKAGRKINLKRCLELILYISIIILVSLVSFFGIYVKNKNTTANKVKKYAVGPDIDKYRNIVIKVSKEENTEDEEDDEEVVEEVVEESEENTELLSSSTEENMTENYDKVRKIVEDRLKYMDVEYYEIKYNQADGTINIKIPEDEVADYIAQYTSTKGEFKISDSETDEVLLSNENIKEAKIGYYTQTSGTTIYLNIEFDEVGKEKLREISNEYQEKEEDTSEDVIDTESSEEISEESIENSEETEETTKQVKLTLDDTTILTTSFEEEITDGSIQLTLGTSSDSAELSEYVKNATNIAIFLNTDTMPVEYELDTNESIYSSSNYNEINSLILIISIAYLILWMKSIVVCKEKGILGLIASIGVIAILLLTVRYANVELTWNGIFAMCTVALLQYIFLSNIINAYINKKDFKVILKHELEALLPIAIIAVVFTLTKWTTIASVGMVLFWGILEIIICNLINIKIICKKEGK